MRQKTQNDQEKKPGSGKIWKRKITIPQEPKFRINSTKNRDKSHGRSHVSLSKIMSKNNISIQNIDLDQRFLYFQEPGNSNSLSVDDSVEESYLNVREYIESKNKLLGNHVSLNPSTYQKLVPIDAFQNVVSPSADIVIPHEISQLDLTQINE